MLQRVCFSLGHSSFPSRLNLCRKAVLKDPAYRLPKNKIVCTIGPATDKPPKALQLIDNGLSVARLNFSHGDFAEHRAQMVAVEEALKSRPGKYVASMLDTKGPEIRTGTLQNGKSVQLKKGQRLQITTDYTFVGNSKKIACSYKDLPKSTAVGGTLLIADSSITCRTTKVGPDFVEVQVLNDAVLGQKKNMALPGEVVGLPTVDKKDVDDIMNFGLKYKVDMIALSFARYGSDISSLKAMMGKEGQHIKIIPKIESHQAIQNFHDIVRLSDGLMVARGDLGMEIPLQKTIIAQKFLLQNCLEEGVFTITATQMLDSMEKKPRPTRAQISDITNAAIDLSDATMLSGETTNGLYPTESVAYMNWTAQEAEAIIDYEFIFRQRVKGRDFDCNSERNVVRAVALSFDLKSDVIVCRTDNGKLASSIAKWRPNSHIIAVCPNEVVARGLSCTWGVHPIVVSGPEGEVLSKALHQSSEWLRNKHLTGIFVDSVKDQATSHRII